MTVRNRTDDDGVSDLRTTPTPQHHRDEPEEVPVRWINGQPHDPDDVPAEADV